VIRSRARLRRSAMSAGRIRPSSPVRILPRTDGSALAWGSVSLSLTRGACCRLTAGCQLTPALSGPRYRRTSI
jgi:hypothetical protein